MFVFLFLFIPNAISLIDQTATPLPPPNSIEDSKTFEKLMPPSLSRSEKDSLSRVLPKDDFDDDEATCTSDKSIIEKLLENYKSFKTPSENGVIVWIEVWVQEVNAVNEITSDFDMDIYVTELWMDSALKYEHLNPCKYNLSLNSEILDQIWKPNTVFINSKSANIHKSPFKNVFLMIYPNGTVWVNYRVQVKGPCAMDFSAFPMDQQSCHLTLESFSYNNQEVDMQWTNWTEGLSLLKKEIILPDFVLTNYSTHISQEIYPAGVWNELTMNFVFSRRYGWYIFQAYIPTYLTIFISWISFCLGPKMIPARTMLGVNSLLALTFQFGNIMRNLPRVSYVKALDVWMLACLTFVFCSLLELAIIGAMGSQKEKKGGGTQNGSVNRSMTPISCPNSPRICRNHVASDTPHGLKSYGTQDPRMRKKMLLATTTPRRSSSEMRSNEKVLLLEGCEETSFIKMEPPFGKEKNENIGLTMEKIDRYSMFLFPGLFTLFNVVYWGYYLNFN